MCRKISFSISNITRRYFIPSNRHNLVSLYLLFYPFNKLCMKIYYYNHIIIHIISIYPYYIHISTLYPYYIHIIISILFLVKLFFQFFPSWLIHATMWSLQTVYGGIWWLPRLVNNNNGYFAIIIIFSNFNKKYVRWYDCNKYE